MSSSFSAEFEALTARGGLTGAALTELVTLAFEPRRRARAEL